MEGIWIWGKPLTIDNDIKLLILDCQGINNTNKDDINNINNKLFILSVLLSTCIIYVTKGELTDDIIKEFFCFTDLSSKINLEDKKNNEKQNCISNLKDYFPEIFFMNDTLKKEEIQTLIETN